MIAYKILEDLSVLFFGPEAGVTIISGSFSGHPFVFFQPPPLNTSLYIQE